nr:hypothetical protein [uncultured Arsenicibacter sp.]
MYRINSIGDQVTITKPSGKEIGSDKAIVSTRDNFIIVEFDDNDRVVMPADDVSINGVKASGSVSETAELIRRLFISVEESQGSLSNVTVTQNGFPVGAGNPFPVSIPATRKLKPYTLVSTGPGSVPDGCIKAECLNLSKTATGIWNGTPIMPRQMVGFDPIPGGYYGEITYDGTNTTLYICYTRYDQ